MNIPHRVVLLSGPEDDFSLEPELKFRLTYSGKLRATNRDPLDEKPDLLALHKHEIRVAFHGQLKELWRRNGFLREVEVASGNYPSRREGSATRPDYISLHDALRDQYPNGKFWFLPLATERHSMMCSLDILFLRRDYPGAIYTAGDLDNRIKTVIDALRPPQKPNEFFGRDKKEIVPEHDQDPFYVLMEDDKQVSHLSVETDLLLDPVTADESDFSKVSLIITVEMKPTLLTMFNLGFF